MSFFNELKRRNVFRVGIAYAIAAWVLLQVVDLVLESIVAPDWVMKVFLLVVAVGFPVAVIIAWAFEMTPEGLKRESGVDRTQSVTSATGRKLDRIIIAFLALAVVFLVIDPFANKEEVTPPATTATQAIAKSPEPEPAQRDKSVAVLPFAFRSNNPDDQFFAEGMHDDLLTQLAKIGSLKVISRTSVMEYKNTTKKIPEIAKELGVATIVEGGVQRSGTRIRFNAQLIDAITDEHLWAETYNRELTAENLFDIQAEIARAIAKALQATLSPAEEASIDQALTGNLQAWEAIQSGRAIDPTLAELDLAEGYYYYWGFRNYQQALPFMQKASAAVPNNSRVHLAHAYVLRRMGDWGSALAALRRASELDPRNSVTLTDMGQTLSRLRRFDEARQAISRAQEADSDAPTNLWLLAEIDLQENGDIKSVAHFTHLVVAPYPGAQLQTWRSSLYLRDFDAALQDIVDWPELFLDSKDIRVTPAMLTGLTHLYAGDTGSARPLLRKAKQGFEAFLEQDPGSFTIARSLCFITGGLGDLAATKQYCKNSLIAAPKDAFDLGGFHFDAAAGLALAGDAKGSVELLKIMLEGDAGPTMYQVIYHPAFDSIRENAAYIELLKQYGPESHE